MPALPNTPSMLARLLSDLEDVRRRRGLVDAKIAWKRNAAGLYVLALLVDPRYFADSERAARDVVHPHELDALLEAATDPREQKRLARQR